MLNCSSLSIRIYLKCSGRRAVAGLWFVRAWDLALSPRSQNTLGRDVRRQRPPRSLRASYLCSGLAVALSAPGGLCAQSRLTLTLWTEAHQAPLSTGILQARTPEWVDISFFRGSSPHRDRTQVSRMAGKFFTDSATRGVQEDWMG